MARQNIEETDGKVVIALKNKMAVLIITSFDGEIDQESLVKIDYSNILGEILTFPVIFNRIANMRADTQDMLAEAKFRLAIFEAQKYEHYQKKLFAEAGKKPSIKDVESALVQDPGYQTVQRDYMRRERDHNYIDAMYWAAQSKDTKLNRLSDKLRPDAFETELMEGSINGVMIKLRQKAMK